MVGLALCCGELAKGGDESVLRDAASLVGSSNSSVIQVLRELSYWKQRALAAESAGSRLGPETPALGVGSEHSRVSSVMGVVAPDRALIVSAGRLSGAVLGALVMTDSGVVAKVVETRDNVSAALVDQSFKGSLESLKGANVRLLVQRP